MEVYLLESVRKTVPYVLFDVKIYKVIRMCSLLAYDYLGHPKFARGSPFP